MTIETISLELLTAKAKRPLGIRLEEIVQTWITKREFTYFYSSDDLVKMQKIVKEEMNIDVEFQIIGRPEPNAVASVLILPGHGGNTYNGPDTKPMTLVGPGVPEKLRKITIDLDKGRISGPWLEGMRNRISLFAGLVTNRQIDLTTEEVVATIIHELGHCYSQYMALGDYVWLNYYLQDGVEVLLGKKPNVYKLEILTEAGLEKYCDDKELLTKLKADPTEANIRRAILLASTKAPRHHLSTKENDTSKLREEQLADLFASRMGYARAQVSLQSKLSQFYGSRYLLTNASWAITETTKVLLGFGMIVSAVGTFVFPPLLLSAIALNTARKAITYHDPEEYDNDLERMNKMRRDLVAQLKLLKSDPMLEEKILEDIRLVDDMLAMYRKHTTLWEAVQHVLSPSYRRQRHQRAREEQLEILLNNDLAVAASKFNALSRNLK